MKKIVKRNNSSKHHFAVLARVGLRPFVGHSARLQRVGFARLVTSQVGGVVLSSEGSTNQPPLHVGSPSAMSRLGQRLRSDGSKAMVPIHFGAYIAGFVDGEGSFYTASRYRGDYATGWKFSLQLNISNGDKAVLEFCQSHLGCGVVRTSRKAVEAKQVIDPKDPTLIKVTKATPAHYFLEVAGIETLRTRIIPFFNQFPFYSNKKKAEFRVFTQAVEFFHKVKVVHSKKELEQFLEYRRKLGGERINRATNSDEAIRASFKPLLEASEDLRFSSLVMPAFGG